MQPVQYLDSDLNTELYTQEDLNGTAVIKKCNICKFVVFIGKSQNVDKSINTVKKVFTERHRCTV